MAQDHAAQNLTTQNHATQNTAVAGRVQYAVHPRDTALISIDFQTGFGDNAWEPVPYAAAALENFCRAAQAWRAAGGLVMHVHTFFTPAHPPGGRMADFAPDIASALGEHAPAAQFYPGLVQAGDVLVHKTNFSAVAGGALLQQLQRRHFTTAVLGGLTTPICVQTSVDALSMGGIKTMVLEDACASQAIFPLSAAAAHEAAIARMGYVFAEILNTDAFMRRAAASLASA